MTEYSGIQQIKEHDETAIITTMEIIFEIFGFFGQHENYGNA